MPTPFVLTLPIDDDQLLDEFVSVMSSYATIHEVPKTYDLATAKLIIDIAAGSMGFLAGSAALIKFLLDLKDRYKKADKPSGITIAQPGEVPLLLEHTDEATLRRLITQEHLKS